MLDLSTNGEVLDFVKVGRNEKSDTEEIGTREGPDQDTGLKQDFVLRGKLAKLQG